MNSAMGGSRQARGHFDPFAQYPPDDRVGGNAGIDPLSRFDRMGPASTIQSTYMLDNNQTWGYNGGVATMSGPINGSGRLGARAVNRRAALPTVSVLNFCEAQKSLHLVAVERFANLSFRDAELD